MAMKTWERRQLVRKWNNKPYLISVSLIDCANIRSPFISPFICCLEQQCNSRQNDSSSSGSSNQNAHPNEIYPRSPLVWGALLGW
jgi:hypothetical protein